MLRQLLSSHDNGQSMVIYHSCMKHAPSVVIVSCQRSEHDYSSLRLNMLCQLSSSHDNGQSMVIYHLCMKHALTVVIVS